MDAVARGVALCGRITCDHWCSGHAGVGGGRGTGDKGKAKWEKNVAWNP